MWGATLTQAPWPGWPRWALGLLVLYALVAGPVGFVLSRRTRPAVALVLLPVLTILTAATCFAASAARSDTAETAIEVRTLGVDGTVLTTTYRGLRALDPAGHGTLPDGAAASTLYSDRRPIGPGSEVASFDPSRPPPSIAPGAGHGSIQTRGGQPGLRFPTRQWAVQTVETAQTGTNGPDIDAVLRLIGGPKTSPGRVTGTVTNRGHKPLRRLQAQTADGQAQLPGILAPGETAQVDAPLLPITTGPPPAGKLTPPQPEDTTMFAASARSFTGPGQVAIAGSTDPKAPSQRADRIAVVVKVATLTGAETVTGGSGGSRMVTASVNLFGQSFAAFDATVPAGAGPLSLRYRAVLSYPGQPPPPQTSVEVYSWTTGTWRPLPTTGHPRTVWVDTPIQEPEVNHGLVRLREQAGPGGGFAGGQLLPRSTSEESEATLNALVRRPPG